MRRLGDLGWTSCAARVSGERFDLEKTPYLWLKARPKPPKEQEAALDSVRPTAEEGRAPPGPGARTLRWRSGSRGLLGREEPLKSTNRRGHPLPRQSRS